MINIAVLNVRYKMATSKPWRDIEVRPKALHDWRHNHCMHSLHDRKKLTKVPNYYLLDIYCSFPERGEQKVKENNKLRRLINRRKLRQKYIASKV